MLPRSGPRTTAGLRGCREVFGTLLYGTSAGLQRWQGDRRRDDYIVQDRESSPRQVGNSKHTSPTTVIAETILRLRAETDKAHPVNRSAGKGGRLATEVKELVLRSLLGPSGRSGLDKRKPSRYTLWGIHRSGRDRRVGAST